MGRNRYFTPAQAIEYGIIDRIVRPQEEARRLASASGSACARALPGSNMHEGCDLTYTLEKSGHVTVPLLWREAGAMSHNALDFLHTKC